MILWAHDKQYWRVKLEMMAMKQTINQKLILLDLANFFLKCHNDWFEKKVSNNF